MGEGNAIRVFQLQGLDCRLEPADWPFARECAEEIARHWAAFLASNRHCFNGRILLQHRCVAEEGTYRAGYMEVDYAAFIAWRAFGYPGSAMRNGFSMAALRAADGAFLLGEMAQGTANAGQVYFAAGTPDLKDLRADGSIDLAGSMIRELEEETGLRPDEVCFGEGWICVEEHPRVAFMREVTIDLPATEARALMLERMAGLAEEELSDIHIVRSKADIDAARMPPFQVAYLNWAFNQKGFSASS